MDWNWEWDFSTNVDEEVKVSGERLSKILYMCLRRGRLSLVEKCEWRKGARLHAFAIADGVEEFTSNNAGKIPYLESSDPKICIRVIDLFHFGQFALFFA